MNRCKICGCDIAAKEPAFQFPLLPAWHKLSIYNGLEVHIDCVKSIDKEEGISSDLADIKEAVMKSKQDASAPWVLRDGNIIFQALLQDFGLSELEIYDYEDFIELEILYKDIAKIKELKESEAIISKFQTLQRVADGKLNIIYNRFETILQNLDYHRLQTLLQQPEVDEAFANQK